MSEEAQYSAAQLRYLALQEAVEAFKRRDEDWRPDADEILGFARAFHKFLSSTEELEGEATRTCRGGERSAEANVRSLDYARALKVGLDTA